MTQSPAPPTARQPGERSPIGSAPTRRGLLSLIGATGAGAVAALAAAPTTASADGLPARRVPNGLATTTIAALRAGTSVLNPTGYYITDSGKEGVFLLDNDDTTSPDDTGTTIVTPSGLRYKRVLDDAYVNATWFGAAGDGQTDDTAALSAADAAAADRHKTLYLPAGTYMQYGITPKASWLSHNGAVIKNNQPASNKYWFFTPTKVTGLRFEGLTFDGAVSADPEKWTNANYNSFTGAIAMHLMGCHSITLVDCVFQNSFWSCLRVENSSDVTVRGCVVTRARGNFGDGMYITGSRDVLVDRCHITDYTRIGLVGEAGSSDLTITTCHAQNGHDCSNLYGGIENNAGYWFEVSANIRVSDCTAQDNTSYGFMVSQSQGSPKATLPSPTFISKCIAINSQTGFQFQGGYGGSAIWAVCRDSAFYGSDNFSGSWAFTAVSKDTKDDLTFDNCFAKLTGQAANYTAGFLIAVVGATTTPRIAVHNSTIEWVTQKEGDLADPTTQYADVFVNSPTNGTITLDRLTTTGSADGAIVKVTGAGAPHLRFRDSSLGLRFINGFGSLDLRDCVVTAASGLVGSASTTGHVRISGSTIAGPLQIQTTGRASFEDSSIAPAAGPVRLKRDADQTGIAARVDGCQIAADVAANGPALVVDDTGAKKGICTVTGSVFVNTSGTPTSDKAFMHLTAAETVMVFDSDFHDSTVANVLDTAGSLSAPGGVAALPMH